MPLWVEVIQYALALFMIVLGICEVLLPSATIRIRNRMVADHTGARAKVRDTFDSTLGTNEDTPQARRNVRGIGVFLIVFGFAYGLLIYFFR